MLTINSDPREIAQAYDDAPMGYNAVGMSRGAEVRAYWALERYVNLRHQDALDDGWRFLRSHDEHYEAHLGECLRVKVLPVFDLKHDHPAWSDETNYRFRAVHDVYGHIPQGDAAPFAYAGELEAAKQQARDIERNACRFILTGHHDGAIQAAFTEVIGQAAYFEVHGKFPVQKAALILAAEGY